MSSAVHAGSSPKRCGASTGGADVGYAQLDVTASRLEFSQVATSGPHAGTVRDRFTITA